MKNKIRWGILGTGAISPAIAKALPETATGELYAIGSRSMDSARKWAAKYPVTKTYGSYAALIADPKVDAVYIALPNNIHCEWVVKAAEAGKHILCEKPLATNAAEVMVMLEACRRHQVFFMEAFMWRCHPGTKAWLDVIRQGTIGQVRMIDADFSFHVGDDNNSHSRLNNSFSAGGIMDVGCYCVSAARAVAGAACGLDFAEPTKVTGAGHIGVTGVDEWAAALFHFPGDITASLNCGVKINRPNQLAIYGSKGKLVVPSPWFHDGKAILHVAGQKEPVVLESPSPLTLYTHEVEMLHRCVAVGRLEAHPPGMTWADSLGQQQAVDQWRKAVGVIFVAEKDESLQRGTLSGKPLRFRSNMSKTLTMPMGRIEGLAKPVSRAIIGSMCLRAHDMPYTTAMLDDYYERGGNAADSAWIYGANCEQALGRWIALRGIRKDFVILGKGAHTPGTSRPLRDPGCDPESIRTQLYESLDRLQTDYLDLYCMHRDNPAIPVGEFVDVLDELTRAGRIRVFGGSNWTRERFDAANEYARRQGRRPFQILSNNFSLAQWNEPLWGNCLASSDAASVEWLKKTGTTLLAWSSQASGFFTGAFDRRTDPQRDGWTREVARVWFNRANFKRLDRAQELARKKNCTPTQIALAYVLWQPFDIYAIIGPRTLEETRTSLEALRIKLTPTELAYLNLERATP